jgi:hypothetical protein
VIAMVTTSRPDTRPSANTTADRATTATPSTRPSPASRRCSGVGPGRVLRFVDGQPDGVVERDVRGHHVARVEPDPVATDHLRGRHDEVNTVTDHPRGRCGEPVQRGNRTVGPDLLPYPDRRVHDHHERDDCGVRMVAEGRRDRPPAARSSRTRGSVSWRPIRTANGVGRAAATAFGPSARSRRAASAAVNPPPTPGFGRCRVSVIPRPRAGPPQTPPRRGSRCGRWLLADRSRAGSRAVHRGRRSSRRSRRRSVWADIRCSLAPFHRRPAGKRSAGPSGPCRRCRRSRPVRSRGPDPVNRAEIA